MRSEFMAVGDTESTAYGTPGAGGGIPSPQRPPARILSPLPLVGDGAFRFFSGDEGLEAQGLGKERWGVDLHGEVHEGQGKACHDREKEGAGGHWYLNGSKEVGDKC